MTKKIEEMSDAMETVEWTDRWDMVHIVHFLGADHVDYINRADSPVMKARMLAMGAWNANLASMFVAYSSLAMLLSGEKGEVL